MTSAEEGLQRIWGDQRQFYSPRNLERLALGIVLAAPLAESRADARIRQWYQEHLRSEASDEAADVVEYAGEYFYTLPVFAAAAIAGAATRQYAAGEMAFDWGQRSLRGFAVGVPPLLLWQHALGSSRPNENDSKWRPFQDDNAASGHSFAGAIPFLAAASMTDVWYWRYLWIAASMAPAWARIDNDYHYFSQAALGWWLAYLSVSSVGATERDPGSWSWTPVFFPDGGGFNLLFSF